MRLFDRLTSRAFWRQPGMHPLRASLGSMLGLGIAAFTTFAVIADTSGLPYLVAPLGASAALVFALPAAPLAQPRAVIGGNILSALCGVTVAQLIAESMLAGPAAAALAILLMQLCRCLHPPGGAVALVAVFGGDAVREAGFYFALLPVGLNSVLLVGAGIIFNNLAGSRYPHRPEISQKTQPDTEDAATIDRSGFTRADVEAALDQLIDRPVIDVADVEFLLRSVESAAFSRTRPVPLCLDIMSRDVVTCQADDWTEDALAKMDRRHVSALPVLDRDERVVGLATRGVLAGEQGRNISEVMQTGACIAAADSAAAALAPVLSDGVHHQAVIVWANGSLAGLVTQTDLIASLWRGQDRGSGV